MNIFDTINSLVNQAGITFRAIVGLVAVIMFFVLSSKVKWAVGSTLVIAFVAGLIIFLCAGGLGWFSTGIGTTVQTTH